MKRVFRQLALLWALSAFALAQIRFYVDDVMYRSTTPKDLPSNARWVFDHPFFINLAVGGNWPGTPDTSTAFPQSLAVDYVRVYRREGKKPVPATSQNKKSQGD